MKSFYSSLNCSQYNACELILKLNRVFDYSLEIWWCVMTRILLIIIYSYTYKQIQNIKHNILT